MRVVLCVALLASACASSPARTPDGAPVHNAVDRPERRYRIRHAALDLAALPPLPELDGVPISGVAALDVDLRIPLVDGDARLERADGRVRFRCLRACALGGPTVFLARGTGSPWPFRLPVPRIEAEHLDVELTIRDGRAELTRFSFMSPDLRVAVTGGATLQAWGEPPMLDVCIWFGAGARLVTREPKIATNLVLYGAPRAANDMFVFRFVGHRGAYRYLRCADPR